MAHDNSTLGKAAFWTSIAGITVPVCLAVLLVLWILLFVPQGRMGPSYEDQVLILAWLAVCLGLFVVLELAALGCGIAARYTAAGKMGLRISSLLLALAALLSVFILYRSGFFKF